ncbi:MAG: flagellar biosynthetic protein FliQ [Sphingopyxis sp.]|nr:flagellar biosynthetic protein FliQ [Sphingopyxis sp.]
MEADFFIGIAQSGLWVLCLAAAPILLPILVTGVLLGMVQAATSINEQTLTFVPKLVIAAVCLALFGTSMLVLLTDFTRDLFAQIPLLVR